ncbi:MAG TPA: hypothetical protein VGN00_19575 [Puia sp.]|jgi:hypothetical protein
MGFSFGGILFRNGRSVQDDTIRDMLKLNDPDGTSTTTMEEAISHEFNDVGMARTDDFLIVIGHNIPFSLSFEGEDKLTGVDRALMTLSEKGDIIGVLSDSVSATYTYSIFSKGKRIRVSKTAGGKLVYESGKPTGYERDMDNGSNRLMKLIENFTGHNYSELVFDLGLKVQVYKLKKNY